MNLHKGYEEATIEGVIYNNGKVDVALNLSHVYKGNRLEIREDKKLWECYGRFSYRFLVNSNLTCSQVVDLQDILQLRLKRVFIENDISPEFIVNKYRGGREGFKENGWSVSKSEKETVIWLSTDKAVGVFKKAAEELITKGWVQEIR